MWTHLEGRSVRAMASSRSYDAGMWLTSDFTWLVEPGVGTPQRQATQHREGRAQFAITDDQEAPSRFYSPVWKLSHVAGIC
jgi:hypothetical protein